jgi:hypothetical protein
MNWIIIIGIGILIVLALVLQRLLTRPDQQFRRYYKEILTSSKYKVKDRFEE